ncbi:MAG TPA: murein biosynthesis integral membrane protein MurJ [Ktedonobacterales bacterium]|nr:murein biosynthesis integral membrane protein MurJ [Ktedonobacterales bacterium]
MGTSTNLEESIPLAGKPARGRGKDIHTGRAVSVVFILNTVGRLFSIVSQVLTASAYGTSTAMDAFTVALVAPTTISLILTTAIGAAFIPVFIEYRENKGEEAALRLFWVATTLGMLLGIIINVVLIAGAPLLITLFGSQMDASTQALAVVLLRFLIPIILMQWLGTLLQSILNSYGRFAATALSSTAITFSRIAFLLVLVKAWGIYALEWSTLLGYALNLLILILAFMRLGMPFRLSFNWRHPALRQIVALASPAFIAALLVNGNSLVDQFMASLLPPGSLSSLGYALRLVDVPSQLFYVTLSMVLLPVFSLQAARREVTLLRDTFSRSVIFTAIALLPASALFGSLARPVVNLFYQYGSFDARDTDVVAGAIMFLAPMVFLITWSFVNARMCNALQNNRALQNVAILSLVANAALDYVLMQIWGIAGITFSTTLTYLVGQIVLVLIVKRRLPELNLRHLSLSLGKVVLASALVWVVCALLVNLPMIEHLAPLLQVGLLGALGLLIALPLLWVLRIPEMNLLWSTVRSRLPLKRAPRVMIEGGEQNNG